VREASAAAPSPCCGCSATQPRSGRQHPPNTMQAGHLPCPGLVSRLATHAKFNATHQWFCRFSRMTRLAPQDDALLNKTADIVFAEIHRDAPIAHLSPARQVLIRIYVAQPIIDNGSLPLFFERDFPDVPDYSLFSDAYRIIGADDVAGYLDAAVALFPFPAPHLDLEGRKRYLAEHCSDYEGEMCELGDRIIDQSARVFSLLADYIRKHPEDF
jgi:hypothetical protein